MIETMQNNQNLNSFAANTTPRKILRMVENDRMAGTVPRWDTAKTSTDKIQQTIENAQQFSESPENALSYAGGKAGAHHEEFGFSDLLDMVNPLHHVPVVGHIYREVTGDTIKPIGQIMGGAVFGGPMGAASGLANTIVEKETGKDIAGNAMAMLSNEPFIPTLAEPHPAQVPEKRLTETIENFDAPHNEALPGSLLSFVDLKSTQGVEIHRIQNAVYPDLAKKIATPRKPITQVKMSGLYALSQ